MSFGENQLKKFGWKEGQGLGREEDGICAPIKAKLKFNKSGVGHNQANEFTFHWWDHVYNKMAQNLSVNKNKEGRIKICKDEEVKLSTKRPTATKKANTYGLFVKGSVLQGSREIPESDSSSDHEREEKEEESKELIKTFSDVELFQLCGGLTGHKGARHGLTMSGKLARLEQQDQIFIQDQNILCEENGNKSSEKDKSKKRKLKKQKEEELETKERNGGENVILETFVQSEEVKTKKKKKKKKREVESESEEVESESVSEEAKIKKKKKLESESESKLELESECISEEVKKKKKKKKREKESDSESKSELESESICERSREVSSDCEEEILDENIQKPKKKKKKKWDR